MMARRHMKAPINVFRITRRKDGYLLRTYRKNARGARSIVGSCVVDPDALPRALDDEEVLRGLGIVDA